MGAKETVFQIGVILLCIQVGFSIINAAGLDNELGAHHEPEAKDPGKVEQKRQAMDPSAEPNPVLSYFSTIVTGAMVVFEFIITLPIALYQVFALFPHPFARTIGASIQIVVDFIIIIAVYQAMRGT